MHDISLNDNSFIFKELEQKNYKMACDEACNALKEILEFLDEKLLNERDTKIYRNKGRKKTCLRTIMGNVEYSRRIYEFNLDNGKKATKFLLDEYLGMDTVGNVSLNLVETILTNVSEMSFRKTSENIEKSCNQSISPQGVWNIVQTVGSKIKDLENRKIELNNSGNVDEGLQAILDLMIANTNDKVVLKKLSELYDYLANNKDGLVPYKLRDNIKLPTPPEGIEYRQLGTMEHNICDVLAKRMKGRKMSWSINGADNLVKILAEKSSNRLFDTIDKIYRNIIPSDIVDTVVAKMPLTVSQAIKPAQKSKVYKCASTSIPYSNAASTLGRKIIKDLCGLKSFSDIGYN